MRCYSALGLVRTVKHGFLLSAPSIPRLLSKLAPGCNELLLDPTKKRKFDCLGPIHRPMSQQRSCCGTSGSGDQLLHMLTPLTGSLTVPCSLSKRIRRSIQRRACAVLGSCTVCPLSDQPSASSAACREQNEICTARYLSLHTRSLTRFGPAWLAIRTFAQRGSTPSRPRFASSGNRVGSVSCLSTSKALSSQCSNIGGVAPEILSSIQLH